MVDELEFCGLLMTEMSCLRACAILGREFTLPMSLHNTWPHRWVATILGANKKTARCLISR